MTKIKLKKYLTGDDYKDNNISKNDEFTVTKGELIKHAKSTGGFSNTSLDSKGEQFYESLVKMAIDKNGGNFTLNNSYKEAETSIKGSISFFLGMIAAKLVAEKEYNISYLFHLKDPQIAYKTKGKIPDFFGLADGKYPYIIEAKGTSSEKKVPSDTVKKAIKQLEDIQLIVVEDDKRTYNYSNAAIHRHVVTSSFEDSVLTYSDIDPGGKKENKIKINLDKELFYYYWPIISTIKNNKKTESKSILGIDFIFDNVGKHKIGLNEELFKVLSEYYNQYLEFKENKKENKKENENKNENENENKNKNEKIDFSGLYRKCNDINLEYKKKYKEINEEYYLSNDGIIYLEE